MDCPHCQALVYSVHKQGCPMLPENQQHLTSQEELVKQLIELIGDVFVRTLEVRLDDDVPQLADDIAVFINRHYIAKEVVAAALPEIDTHSHMTRNYCTDCAKRDGHNEVLRDIRKALNLDNGTEAKTIGCPCPTCSGYCACGKAGHHDSGTEAKR